VIIPSRQGPAGAGADGYCAIRTTAIAAGAAAAIAGTIVAIHYARLGLTLSHYDARGHLIVARRVLDSITPGWQQIGAVWLPLPHLLNLLPAQIDAFYRTGASGVAISILSFALATGGVAWITQRLTDSTAAAVLASAAFAVNPNVLYLQSTPMTEPLLLALTLAAVALLIAWCDGALVPPWRVGAVMALACLTRYEAWPVAASALAAAVWTRWRSGDPLAGAARQVAAIAAWPGAALLAFAIHSRVVVGEWFTASGFFVPENKSLGRPFLALAEIGWGAHALSGTLTLTLAAIGLAALAANGLFVRRRSASLIAVSLAASAALPWAAFLKGHPFRIRYMVPLIAIEAIGIGAAAVIVRRAIPIVALVAALAVASEARPLSSAAPMVLEAQWDRPNVRDRQRVTDCLRSQDDGETIMASMGSLGHYMQEMSRDGFDIRRFLHEGNGDIWLFALDGPRRYAGWILIEEKAEGGDMLAHLTRERPAFLDGYTRLCEGAGVSLYRRLPPPARP
jgi:hypothetical protein